MCSPTLRKRFESIVNTIAVRLSNAHLALVKSSPATTTLEARSAWSALAGSDTIAVIWSEFWSATRYLIAEPIDKFVTKMRALLDPLETGVVRQTTFAAFCAAFGPIYDARCIATACALADERWCACVSDVRELVTPAHTRWYAYQSTDEADHHLAHRRKGTFIVRFALPTLPVRYMNVFSWRSHARRA
jgi:hypothetical protein